MADFDRQLVESDAYLQLLIQQAQALQRRQASCAAGPERARLANIADTVNVSTEYHHLGVVLSTTPCSRSPCSRGDTRAQTGPGRSVIPRWSSGGGAEWANAGHRGS